MKKILAVFAFVVVHTVAHAQNIFPSSGSAGIGTTTPNPSSLMEMISTTKGLLIPRMTKTQRDAIASPATGLMIYQTNLTPGFYYFDGSAWLPVSVKGPNKTLSNLTGPTAVNVDLIPNANNLLSLGSSSKAWKNIYAGSSYYIGGRKVLDVSGVNNTFVGVTSNTANTGNGNTFTGASAGTSNTTGSLNTTMGTYSLFANTSGDLNSAYGFAALESNTSGHHNTAIGAYALVLDSTGYLNTATGTFSLSANTTGFNNTATGASSLDSNTTGYYNTATGALSLGSNKTGYYNNAVGAKAMYSNITGSQNTASGCFSLYNNTSGTNNVSIGHQSLYYNTAGYGNTALGAFAMQIMDNGNYNTSVGMSSMTGTTTGSYNTAIGCQTSANAANYSFTSVLGYGAVSTASNQVRIGNNSVTSIGGYVNWTNISDGRVKKNIKQNVPGLAFINKLQPVTYNLDLAAADKIIQRPALKDKDARPDDSVGRGKTIQPSKEDVSTRNEKEKVLYTGFVAQDVEKVAKELNYDFSGVDIAKNDHDLYGLRYSDFVVPLVKAVQELSQQNDELKKQNDDLEKRLEKLEAIMNVQQSTESSNLQTANLNSSSLEQNTPNPFNANTTIKYYLPANNGNSYINFYNNNGALLKSVKLKGTGNGSITLNAGELSSGIYRYTLLSDKKVIDSKQMERLR